MREKKYFCNTMLTVILGVALLINAVVHAFSPAVVLPDLNIPNIVLISLLAMFLENYLKADKERSYPGVFLLAALSFGVLTFAGGVAEGIEILSFAVIGAIVFTVTAWIFDSIVDRISTGLSGKLTLVICAFGIYLAAQGFAGILL